MCRGKNFGMIGAAQQWAGLPFEVRRVHWTEAGDPLVGEPYGDTNSRVAWEVEMLSSSQTQLLLDFSNRDSTGTGENYAN